MFLTGIQVQASLITRHGDRSPCNVLPVENITWTCQATDYVDLVSPPISQGPAADPIY